MFQDLLQTPHHRKHFLDPSSTSKLLVKVTITIVLKTIETHWRQVIKTANGDRRDVNIQLLSLNPKCTATSLLKNRIKMDFTALFHGALSS